MAQDIHVYIVNCTAAGMQQMKSTYTLKSQYFILPSTQRLLYVRDLFKNITLATLFEKFLSGNWHYEFQVF